MRILHLEDSGPDAELVAAKLTGAWPDCRIRRAATKDQFVTALETGDFDLILSDYTLHGFDGLSALELARVHCPAKPFVFLSGTIGEERAIEALKSGASDYVIKDRPSRLVPAIRRALERSQEEQRFRQAEEALSQNRERFRQITENVADLILMLDLTGRCVYANPAYASSVARPTGEADEDVFAHVHPDDRGMVRDRFYRTARTGADGRVQYRLVRGDGGIRYVDAQVNAVRDPRGALTQVIIVARDETERREAEEQIHQQAELLDRAQDAILMRDLNDRITYWNQSASRIYGWVAAEAKGRTAAELWAEDAAQAEVARRATLASGEWLGEMRQHSRAGADLIMQSRWSLVRGKGREPTGFLVINTDVAEKKRLEAQFLRVQRTESIGLLAGGVAHDINNVLMPILISSELLEPMISDPDGKKFIASIRTSAQHGAALVKQLLGFARGVVGHQADLSLQPLLGDFVEFVSQTFPKSVKVVLEADEGIWPVRGDATQLKQVLMNLCINARDAMPEGGRIIIMLANAELDQAAAAALRELKPGPHVVISVVDSGMGMPPAVLEKIFDPFFTTKEVGKGTGLGLATVRGIVKGHNGTIAVESSPACGTTFRIYLPALSTPGTMPPVQAKASPGRGTGQGILLVDDEAWVRDILGSLLSASGYRVFKAASGNEAIRLFQNIRDEVALVLTDIMMADGDGFAAINGLRRQKPDLPMIAMSGMAASGRYDEELRRLGVALLAKPITRDMLIASVQAALATTARA
ncbi:MAG TPA: response regulator [Opitutus sp.]|nr:response regulator [Opitutus sp.]